MLINAEIPEELRVAIVEDSRLEHYQLEFARRELTRGNIYRGTIASIQPSLNAAFIDYGEERNGFLPIQDVVPEAYYGEPQNPRRPKIEEVLERGKPVIVQVLKEAVAEKGAALTTNLSLAGRYLVLTPFDGSRGISRKVEDGDARQSLKALVRQLELPDGAGVIVRTNALDQTKTTLQRDLNALSRLWKQISADARKTGEDGLLYSDQDLVLQTLRDYLDSSVEEVLIDSDDAFHKAQEYRRAFMPRSKTRLLRYKGRTPLFERYRLEPQVASIYDRRVPLPSGGSIVVDSTEALTAIDVNSGRSTGAGSQEETAVHTNVEAAEEVARQLRLRDIGGLVVVDFIDMRSFKNRREVEKQMRAAMKVDKARSSVGRISSNGLLEINRQRIQQALHLRTHVDCPHCHGTGHIPSPELIGQNILRRIGVRAARESLTEVIVRLHPEVALAVQNAVRRDLAKLEEAHGVRIAIVGAPELHPTQQEIDWPREYRRKAKSQPSRRKRSSKSASAKEAKKTDAATVENDDEAGKAGAASKSRRSRSRRRAGRRRGKRGQKSSEGGTAAQPEATESGTPAGDSGNAPEVVATSEGSATGGPPASEALMTGPGSDR